MYFDKDEIDAIKDVRKHPKYKFEAPETVGVERLVNICQNLAKKAFGQFAREVVIDQATAEKDNQFIDRNTGLIKRYKGFLVANSIENEFNLSWSDGVDNTIEMQIADREFEMVQIKTTSLTADKIAAGDHTKTEFNTSSLSR